MDMGSLVGKILGILMNYERAPMSIIKGSLIKPDIDSSSYGVLQTNTGSVGCTAGCL